MQHVQGASIWKCHDILHFQIEAPEFIIFKCFGSLNSESVVLIKSNSKYYSKAIRNHEYLQAPT